MRMKTRRYTILKLCSIACLLILCHACKKKHGGGSDNPPIITPPPAFDINTIEDTYASIAPFAYYNQWSVYNVHDPSIKKFGDYYYCYSTDVGFGINVRSG